MLGSSLRQYHFVSKTMTWVDAQTYCRGSYTDLATIGSEGDTARLVQLLKDHGHSSVWIGLYQDVQSWQWSLKESTFYGKGDKEYRDWFPGQPDNYGNGECCVEILNDSINVQWNDVPCDHNNNFICYDGKFKRYLSLSLAHCAKLTAILFSSNSICCV